MKGCCPTPDHVCFHCHDTGTVALPGPHPQAPGIPCPYCTPDAYPDGFPGLVGILPGTWILPPNEATTTSA